MSRIEGVSAWEDAVACGMGEGDGEKERLIPTDDDDDSTEGWRVGAEEERNGH